MLGNRQSQHKFSQIPSVNIQRSQFDRSFAIKDTFDFDYLIPIFIDEIIPGDTANLSVSTFARLATQKVPIMDNMYLDYFFFFVPNRLVWDNWERFCGAKDDPGDLTDFVIPIIECGTLAVGSIYDKFGIPTGIGGNFDINALPLRCYNKIWNDWFRDENLQQKLNVPKSSNGPDLTSDYVLQKRGKRHDYFTSCLPWPQKGPSITLPLGLSAPVKSYQATTGHAINPWIARAVTDGTALTSTNVYAKDINGSLTNYPITTNMYLDPVDTLYTDLSTATAASINQLREAFQIQSIYELDARGGTRYVELLSAHFHVTSPDFRLQRAEYLGGGTANINSHPVPQTAPTSGSNAQAQLASFATSASTGIGFTKSFVEHGYVIGLVAARADITYQQGLNRMWSRQTRFDFFWPKLQDIGEQPVYNREIYLDASSTDSLVFGYQERYSEYKYKPSEIHGEFRSTFTTPLDMWHMAEEFSALPLLNDEFIVQNTPIERALAINTAPHILFDAYFTYKHARPMAVYSIPAHLGRF